MWFLAKDFASTVVLNNESNKTQAGQEVLGWFQSLKITGGFGPVSKTILETGRQASENDRVSDQQTLDTIRSYYEQIGDILDPHSAVGVTVAKRSMARAAGSRIPHISLATAHPAKFSAAVTLALKHEESFDFEKSVIPPELARLAQMETRITTVENSWETVREWLRSRLWRI